MPTKPVAKKPIPGKPQAVKPAQKNVVQNKPAPGKTKGLRLLKETPQSSLVQKKPTPKPVRDKVENLAKEYLAELKEVDVTFEKGTAVLEKYRAKYPEFASYIREIVPGDLRIEIRQRLAGKDINLHLFAIRVLEDEVRYEVKLSGGRVLGLLLTTQASVQHLSEGASIINIGSVASRITPPNSAVYTGTKAAVDAITGVLARELGPKRIRVNTINPGVVETEGTYSGGVIGSDFEKGAIAQTPLGRIGQPGDIASVAVFLAPEDSAWLTGEQLLATGGLR